MFPIVFPNCSIRPLPNFGSSPGLQNCLLQNHISQHWFFEEGFVFENFGLDFLHLIWVYLKNFSHCGWFFTEDQDQYVLTSKTSPQVYTKIDLRIDR